MKKNVIIQGDCIEEMKKLPANSIDTVICDPPYALGFMGKAWDKFPSDTGPKKPFANQSKEQKLGGAKFQKWTQQWAKEALRVAKPGATLLTFGGTRTYHRMACAIEDAGWILKDCIMWLYGSGFPKATDISKQLDKGHKRKVVGHNLITPRQRERGTNRVEWTGALKKPIDNKVYGHDERNLLKRMEITEPATPEAKLWNGWKSHGLKPAYEPIIVAMKPNEGSYANNALKHGVAGLNIDGGRIGYESEEDKTHSFRKGVPRREGITGVKFPRIQSNKGRFPANIILDEEAAKLLDEQSGVSKSMGHIPSKGKGSPFGGDNVNKQQEGWFKDVGGASRFFKII